MIEASLSTRTDYTSRSCTSIPYTATLRWSRFATT